MFIQLNHLNRWESFHQLLERDLKQERKRIDPLNLFIILDLQQLLNINVGEALRLRLKSLNSRNDCLSFEEFVGLGVTNLVLHALAESFFRRQIGKVGVIEELLEMFASYLRSQGPQAQSVHIIDATLIPVLWQRNIREENKGINPGKLPDSRDENQDRLQKKDIDSHLVQKNDINYYVYKKSICNNIDRGYTLHYAATTRQCKQQPNTSAFTRCRE